MVRPTTSDSDSEPSQLDQPPYTRGSIIDLNSQENELENWDVPPGCQHRNNFRRFPHHNGDDTDKDEIASLESEITSIESSLIEQFDETCIESISIQGTANLNIINPKFDVDRTIIIDPIRQEVNADYYPVTFVRNDEDDINKFIGFTKIRTWASVLESPKNFHFLMGDRTQRFVITGTIQFAERCSKRVAPRRGVSKQKWFLQVAPTQIKNHKNEVIFKTDTSGNIDDLGIRTAHLSMCCYHGSRQLNLFRIQKTPVTIILKNDQDFVEVRPFGRLFASEATVLSKF